MKMFAIAIEGDYIMVQFKLPISVYKKVLNMLAHYSTAMKLINHSCKGLR